jgi:hypothetical protein
MGKRLSESIGSGMDADDYQDVDAGRKRASFLRRGRKGTNDSESSREYDKIAYSAHVLISLV